ncbi:MAG: hypothetical protein ABH821_01585 [archaeon]
MVAWQCLNSSYLKSKGFVLSIDALLAVGIFILLSYLVFYHSFEARSNPEAVLMLQQNFNDSLDLMDKERILQSMNESLISSQLDSVLSSQYGWKLKIQEFKYSHNNFELEKEIILGQENLDLNLVDVARGRRLFLSFDNNTIEYYYNAEYWAWLNE